MVYYTQLKGIRPRRISEGKHSNTRKGYTMSDNRPMEYQFLAVTTIKWTLNENDLRNLGHVIEQVISSWLEGHTIVEDGANVPVNIRQNMLRVITNFMCSDNFEWAGQ